MLAALIAGERNPKTLVALARARMRAKVGALEEAFTGHFSDHHAFLLAKMLTRIDALTADIAELDARIEELLAPYAPAVARLDAIPGIGRTAAAVLIAEVGVDMTRFPTPAHLSSWARLAPGSRNRRGRRRVRAAPGTATGTWPASSARPRSAPGAPRPSSASATGAWPAAADPRRPWSRSAARS
jgi:transposase